MMPTDLPKTERAPDNAAAVAVVAAVFRPEGEYWTIKFDGATVHMRDAKGIRYVARLLAAPGQALGAQMLHGLAADPLTDAGVGAVSTERARSAVTKRIKDAIKKIHTCHPALGRHLMRTVHTGFSCVYQPDPDRPIRWVLS